MSLTSTFLLHEVDNQRPDLACSQVIAMGSSHPKKAHFCVPDKHLGGSLLGALFRTLYCLVCVHIGNAPSAVIQRVAVRTRVTVCNGLSWLTGVQHQAVLNWSRIS